MFSALSPADNTIFLNSSFFILHFLHSSFFILHFLHSSFFILHSSFFILHFLHFSNENVLLPIMCPSAKMLTIYVPGSYT